jgi:putative hydrolase of the HAD superfamily
MARLAMRAIDTVLFDLDDTLHDDSAAFAEAAARVGRDVERAHGVDAAAVARAYIAEANRFWKQLSANSLGAGILATRTEMWHAALRAVGIDDARYAAACGDAYGAYRSDVLALYPGALMCITALRERGCRLGIVTNGFAATHYEKIERLGLTPLFDALFMADEVGMVKPDPGIFRHACAVLGSDPARTAMVGDRYDRDVIGAAEAGLFTVLIDVHRTPLPPGGRPPDAVVATVADVLAVLPLAEAA